MVSQKDGHFVCETCKYRYPAKEYAQRCEDNCRAGTFDPDLEDYGLPPLE